MRRKFQYVLAILFAAVPESKIAPQLIPNLAAFVFQ